MVLGLRSKNKKSTTIHLDYIIHFQEIKPWPPSQSLRSVRSVVLQWESGDHRKSSAGSTAAVTLSPGEGKIEFNEPFRFRTALLREASGTFQKNVLELNLYEHPRRDRAVKGQHLGTAAVDLAEHGVITEPVSVGVPLSCKRTFRNIPQPVLYLRIQPQDKEGSSSSLSTAGSLSKDFRESVSALMNGEYADEAEIASFTDDDDEDVSAHSSVTRSSSALGDAADMSVRSSPGKDGRDHDENLLQEMETARVEDTDSPSESVLEKLQVEPVAKASMSEVAEVHLSESSSLDLPTDPASVDGTDAFLSSSPHRVLVSEKQETSGLYSSSSEIFKDKEKGTGFNEEKGDAEGTDLLQGTQEKMVDCRGEGYAVDNHLKKEGNINGIIVEAESSDIDLEKEKKDVVIVAVSQSNFDEDVKTLETANGSVEAASNHAAHNMFVNWNIEHKPIENGSKEKSGETESRSTECLTENTGNHSDIIDGSVVNTSVIGQHEYLQKSFRKSFSSEVNTLSRRGFGEKGNGTLASDRADNIFPIRPNLDLNGSIRYGNNHQYMEDVKEIDVLGNVRNSSVNAVSDDRLDDQQNPSSSSYKVILASRINRNSFSDNKARELSLKIERLEGELKEAAAIEISLYSVVAEHGSSTNKVHTPARRLSRLYNHASKQLSREKMASAAKSAVSGLVLAAKACGNDVPRLTFWLSNSVVLRAIVAQPIGHSNIFESVGPSLAANGIGVVSKKKSSPLKWESPRKKEMLCSTEEYNDWEDRNTFITALERIEAWIFSRIIESIWWQALAPHMQPSNECCEPMATSPSKKKYGRKSSLDNQQQPNSSFEIWKKAFKDAYEKLCPVRAAGHECGCLPVLARLVMEQCVARLDVAMFNAILREPDDEIPTDPVSDPISNSKVLPIPSGKLSFGAGAQLKNAIGSWSRWLTDLFGMDADDSPQDENEKDDMLDVAASFKSFHVLNALSDLLMLPKDMLSESSIRKEVCPAFSSAIIKQILSSFMPDEFCPDPIPDMLLEALDSEDPPAGGGEEIRSFPCSASPVSYSPPSISSVEGIIGNVRRASLQRSGSSVVRKCHTSDDELDDLDSPLGSIVLDKSLTPTAKSKGNNGATPVRYRLLREVWRDDE